MLRAEGGSRFEDEPLAGAAVPSSAAETWVLQGDAAARTGFSVSAIRKWRRMGLVAERKVAAGGDLPRVEVKLEDVLARAALQPQRRPLPGSGPAAEPADPPSGSVVIGLDDLEALYDRMVRAEGRAEAAEAELQALQIQARYTLGQLAELRRQLQVQHAGPVAAPPPPPELVTPPPAAAPAPPVASGDGVSRTRTGTGPVRPVPATPNVVVVPAPRPRPAPAVPAAQAVSEREPELDPEPSDVDRLARRLRQVYARLDGYRRVQTISPAEERERQRELAHYDRALLALCSALGIDTGLRPGQPVSVDARAGLTRALARAGFDVRGTTPAPTR